MPDGGLAPWGGLRGCLKRSLYSVLYGLYGSSDLADYDSWNKIVAVAYDEVGSRWRHEFESFGVGVAMQLAVSRFDLPNTYLTASERPVDGWLRFRWQYREEPFESCWMFVLPDGSEVLYARSVSDVIFQLITVYLAVCQSNNIELDCATIRKTVEQSA